VTGLVVHAAQYLCGDDTEPCLAMQLTTPEAVVAAARWVTNNGGDCWINPLPNGGLTFVLGEQGIDEVFEHETVYGDWVVSTDDPPMRDSFYTQTAEQFAADYRKADQ
jgi:hypothetical protein